MNQYKEMISRHDAEFNSILKVFAFTEEGVERNMKELGVSSMDELAHLGGGIYVRKMDIPRLGEMSTRFRREQQEAIDADKNGYSFVYQMFYTMLEGHDFCFTLDAEDALEALDMTIGDIENNPKLKRAFERAKRKLAW